jgi:thiol-disulfide isomerase/thioredoxin
MNIRMPVRAHRATALVGLLLSAACQTHPRLRTAQERVEIEVLTAADTVAQVALLQAGLPLDSARLPVTPHGAGKFSVALPERTDRIALWVLVPEHAPLRVTATLPPERPARLQLRARRLLRWPQPRRASVIGDFNGFDTTTAVALVPRDDGRLTATIPFTGDSARVQVLGVGGAAGERGAWMTGVTFAPGPSVTGSRTFAGVVRARNGSLHIVVDTAALPRTPALASITTLTSDAALARANSVWLEREDAIQLRMAAFHLMDSLNTVIGERARAEFAQAQDPLLRKQLLVSILSTIGARVAPPEDGQYGDAFLREVSPGDPVLLEEAGADAAVAAVSIGVRLSGTTAADSAEQRRRWSEGVERYLAPVARNTRLDETFRAGTYIQLAYATRDSARFAWIDEGIATFPKNEYLTRLPASIGRQRTLRVGSSFPAFHLQAISADSLTLTNEIFRGKLTLIDFWATWCKPCVTEMPALHDAHRRFAARGFTILSISADQGTGVIERFRRDKWPMPWMHAWSGAGDNTPVLRALGVNGFPTAVLVDSTGTIIETSEKLRGADLNATLQRLLPPR